MSIHLHIEKTLEAQRLGLIRPGDVWCGHIDFPGYLVGAHGAVISLLAKPRLLKTIARGKYRGFTLRNRNGKLCPVYLHHLVVEIFRGPRPDGMECRHINSVKEDCDAENLKWGTHLENEADKVSVWSVMHGERNGAAVLTAEQVVEMRKIRSETGAFYSIIAKQFGVSTMTAFRAITKRAWQEV